MTASCQSNDTQILRDPRMENSSSFLELVKELKPIFGNHYNVTRIAIRRSLERMRDESVLRAHVKALQEKGWPDWCIKKTLLSRPLPPTSELLRLHAHFREIGFAEFDAIRMVVEIKAISMLKTAEDVDAFIRRSEIARNGTWFDASRLRKRSMQQISSIITTPEETLRQITEGMKKEEISPTSWMSMLAHKLRQHARISRVKNT